MTHLSDGCLAGGRIPGSTPRRARWLLSAVALLPLAACNQENQSLFAPTCPQTEIVSEAADAFTYDGRGLDVGSLVYHASLQGLTGSCAQHGKHVIRTRLSLTMRVTRGAAAHGASIEVPYFVVVMHNDHIVDKKVFSPPINLDPTSDTSTIRTPVISIDLPGDRDMRPEGYRLEVGFQLSHAQLDFNRSHLAPVGFKTQ